MTLSIDPERWRSLTLFADRDTSAVVSLQANVHGRHPYVVTGPDGTVATTAPTAQAALDEAGREIERRMRRRCNA